MKFSDPAINIVLFNLSKPSFYNFLQFQLWKFLGASSHKKNTSKLYLSKFSKLIPIINTFSNQNFPPPIDSQVLHMFVCKITHRVYVIMLVAQVLWYIKLISVETDIYGN